LNIFIIKMTKKIDWEKTYCIIIIIVTTNVVIFFLDVCFAAFFNIMYL
jgi:hypothetical protein